MAWTYNIATDLGKVRLLIGDTDDTDEQLQDAEITYFIDSEMNLQTAAARACQALAARYARQANKKMGDLSIEMEKISAHYTALAETLYSQGATYAVPSAGGIDVVEKQQQRDDSSTTQSFISRGMHDFVSPPVGPNQS